jgi:hypothetical protein
MDCFGCHQSDAFLAECQDRNIVVVFGLLKRHFASFSFAKLPSEQSNKVIKMMGAWYQATAPHQVIAAWLTMRLVPYRGRAKVHARGARKGDPCLRMDIPPPTTGTIRRSTTTGTVGPVDRVSALRRTRKRTRKAKGPRAEARRTVWTRWLEANQIPKRVNSRSSINKLLPDIMNIARLRTNGTRIGSVLKGIQYLDQRHSASISVIVVSDFRTYFPQNPQSARTIHSIGIIERDMGLSSNVHLAHYETS